MYLLRKLFNSRKIEKVVISKISTSKTSSCDTTRSHVGFLIFFDSNINFRQLST